MSYNVQIVAISIFCYGF